MGSLLFCLISVVISLTRGKPFRREVYKVVRLAHGKVSGPAGPVRKDVADELYVSECEGADCIKKWAGSGSLGGPLF